MSAITQVAKTFIEQLNVNENYGQNKFKILPSSQYNIVFSNGCIVVRVSLSKSFLELKQEVKLIRFLKNHNYPVPEVIILEKLKLDNKVYPLVIYEYIKHDKVINPTDKQLSEAAHYLANFHKLTKEYCNNNDYKQNKTLIYDLIKFRDHLRKLSPKSKAGEDLLLDIAWAIDFYKNQKDYSDNYVLHNDYRIQNVLFKGSDIIGVIDFDWSVKSPFLIKDVAHSALSWSFPDGGVLNERQYKLFIAEYEKTSNINLDEEKLSDWVKFSALADAAEYFLSNFENVRDEFKSYMYSKYKYFLSYGD